VRSVRGVCGAVQRSLGARAGETPRELCPSQPRELWGAIGVAHREAQFVTSSHHPRSRFLRRAPPTSEREHLDGRSPLRSVVDEAQLPHLAAPGSQSHSQPATGGATHTTAAARARARDQARRQTGTLPNVTLRLATGNGGGSGTGVPIHGDKRSAAAGSTGRLAGGKSARLATRG